MGDILEVLGVPAWSFWVVVLGVGGLILSNTSLGPKLLSLVSGAGKNVSNGLSSKTSNRDIRLGRLLEDHNAFVWANNETGAAKMMEAIHELKAEPTKVEVVNVEQK